jgi:hypothetical protein
MTTFKENMMENSHTNPGRNRSPCGGDCAHSSGARDLELRASASP